MSDFIDFLFSFFFFIFFSSRYKLFCRRLLFRMRRSGGCFLELMLSFPDPFPFLEPLPVVYGSSTSNISVIYSTLKVWGFWLWVLFVEKEKGREGKKRKGRKGKERKGKERKGKERKGTERKRKERKKRKEKKRKEKKRKIPICVSLPRLNDIRFPPPQTVLETDRELLLPVLSCLCRFSLPNEIEDSVREVTLQAMEFADQQDLPSLTR